VAKRWALNIRQHFAGNLVRGAQLEPRSPGEAALANTNREGNRWVIKCRLVNSDRAWLKNRVLNRPCKA
jgi:hypothetical protein